MATGASANILGCHLSKRLWARDLPATCDGFFFVIKRLLSLGAEIPLVKRRYTYQIFVDQYISASRDALRAEKVLQDRVFKKAKQGNISLVWNAQVKEILGDEMG